MTMLSAVCPENFGTSSVECVPFKGNTRFRVTVGGSATGSNTPVFVFRMGTPCSACLGNLSGRRVTGLGSLRAGLNGCYNLVMNSVRDPGGNTKG